MGKLDFISALKQLFKPKVGSARWFNSFPKMTTQELKDIRVKCTPCQGQF